jgi:hypothetical protein
MTLYALQEGNASLRRTFKHKRGGSSFSWNSAVKFHSYFALFRFHIQADRRRGLEYWSHRSLEGQQGSGTGDAESADDLPEDQMWKG